MPAPRRPKYLPPATWMTSPAWHLSRASHGSEKGLDIEPSPDGPARTNQSRAEAGKEKRIAAARNGASERSMARRFTSAARQRQVFETHTTAAIDSDLARAPQTP